MMCEGAAVTLIRGFADLRQWLPLIIPGKVDRTTRHVAISADLFIVRMMGTEPGIYSSQFCPSSNV